MSASSPSEKRKICVFCDRPQKTCLCEALPKGYGSEHGNLKSTSPYVEQILILQHPQERKQKHCSDYFLLRTLANVYCIVGRKLQNLLLCEGEGGDSRINITNSTSSNTLFATKTSKKGLGDTANDLAASSAHLQEKHVTIDKQRTFVLYPQENAVTGFDELRQLLDVSSDQSEHRCGVGMHTLIVVDATWQFAKEMVNSCEFMRDLPKVALSADLLKKYRSEFVVRKPERVKVGNDEILGFSTAEAVAVFLQEWCTYCALKEDVRAGYEIKHAILDVGVTESQGSEAASLYETVLAPLRKYVEYQLAFTSNVKHRTERKDYDPNLYASRQAEKRMEQDTQTTQCMDA